MKVTRILICEDSLEGILSAVYEAYVSRYGLHDIRVQIGESDPEFFTEQVVVETNLESAVKVADAIKQKMSAEAFSWIRNAACAANKDKAHAIYRMIVYGLHMGPQVLSCLWEPSVLLVSRLSRQVWRETQHLYGFVRFKTLTQNFLYAEINPKHRQLELIADHFADRFSCEHWMICDEVRHMACIHGAGQSCVFIRYNKKSDLLPEASEISAADDFEQLWLSFVDAVTIDQRHNPKQQMTMLPKFYWKHMLEMRRKLL